MKMMIGLPAALASLISAITDLRRFSNSPLTPGAGLQQAHVEAEQLDVLAAAAGTSPSTMRRASPSTSGGLADAGLADQDRVVLAAAGQDVDHLADLLVAAEHRVELRRRGPLR